MLFIGHPVSKQTGRILSGYGVEIDSMLCRLTIIAVHDDGYVIETRSHFGGQTSQFWIEGDLPKGLRFHKGT